MPARRCLQGWDCVPDLPEDPGLRTSFYTPSLRATGWLPATTCLYAAAAPLAPHCYLPLCKRFCTSSASVLAFVYTLAMTYFCALPMRAFTFAFSVSCDIWRLLRPTSPPHHCVSCGRCLLCARILFFLPVPPTCS